MTGGEKIYNATIIKNLSDMNYNFSLRYSTLKIYLLLSYFEINDVLILITFQSNVKFRKESIYFMSQLLVSAV